MAAPHSVQDGPLAPATDATPAPSTLWQRHQPFWLSLIVLLVICGWCYALCVGNTGGPFVYPLDDTYIHLAMAQTLAGHGIWGVNAAEGFASAASSLIWPAQLAGLVLIFGPQDWLPLALNLVYGVLALLAAYWVLISSGSSRRQTFWVLMLVILATSLPVLVLLGMEHTMQAAVDLLFAWVAACALAADKPSRRRLICLGLLAVLVTAARYEGMFLVLAVALTALLVRRWRLAVLLSVLGALPLVAFGFYALSQGGLWLPNPIAVKSDFYEIHSVRDFLQLMVGRKLAVFLGATAVVVPVLLALFGVVMDASRQNRLTPRDRLFVLIVVLTCGMHLFGARTGWFTRYEAYLVFIALLAAWIALRPLLERSRLRLSAGDPARAGIVGASVVLLGLVLAAPLVQRMGEGLFLLPTASKNIHDQQIQMARFVKQYYDGQPVVINDLGAISFYTDARPVDIAGLATLPVARAIIARQSTPKFLKFLEELAHEKGARIAIIYTSWMPGGQVPDSWVKVGSWRIQNNVICGDEVVDFYALDADTVLSLDANLRAFGNTLPADVKQSRW